MNPAAPKLHKDVAAVKRAMRKLGWASLWAIQGEAIYFSGRWMPEQTVSARVRDLRKAKFGSHRVDRRYAGNGVWEYKLYPAKKS
jgi:hypothetical protein